MRPLPLFSACGVELEYMIVEAETLDVLPVADAVLKAVTGEYSSDYEEGPIAWSNELALHVLELKTNGPARSLEPLPKLFDANVRRINDILGDLNARLMPTAMHPWMDPHRELKLWPHENSPIYEAFNKVFDCTGHGWANLQSVHLNLPFRGDEEFGRLHAAIRLLLPLLPGLAASSPIMDGAPTGFLDNRLEVYRTNSRRIKSVTGRVIPEPAYTQAEYDRQIFQPMFADIAPYDPHGTLQHEFLNARGAIARFSRGAIEIRVLDVQECPLADVAMCALIIHVLKRLVAETWTPLAEQQAVPIDPLESVLLGAIRVADAALVDDADYLRHFGLADLAGGTVGEVWRKLLDDACREDAEFAKSWREPLDAMLSRGPLARRILNRLGGDATREQMHAVYGELATCAANASMFAA
jgi:gamma-glutamyl:cysteine ligase YbdK (ATP-grasp superfamily)